VIPAFNEADGIVSTLEAAVAFLREEAIEGEVIVVDDGSRDETAALVDNFRRDHPEVKLLRNERNRGKGYSVRRGMLEARGSLRLFCDADGSSPLREARKLFARLEGGEADVAIGSREMPDSDVARPQPRYRRVMGWVFRKLVAALVVRGFRDTQCGFKAFRAEAARDVFRSPSMSRPSSSRGAWAIAWLRWGCGGSTPASRGSGRCATPCECSATCSASASTR